MIFVYGTLLLLLGFVFTSVIDMTSRYGTKKMGDSSDLTKRSISWAVITLCNALFFWIIVGLGTYTFISLFK